MLYLSETQRAIGLKERSLLSSITIALIICFVLSAFPFRYTFASYVKPPSNAEDRNNYRKALRALEKKEYLRYEQLQQTLKDYPLYAYLRYEYLASLEEIPDVEINQLKSVANNPIISNKLDLLKLTNLGKNKQWDEFLRSFAEIDQPSTELECYYGEALYYHQQTQKALAIAEQKWGVPYSQPNECNRLFRLWSKQPNNPGSLAWKRYKKAVRFGEHKIANYIYTQFFGSLYKEHAQLYKQLRREPLLVKHALLDKQTQIHKNIYYSALRRLVNKDIHYVKQQLQRQDITDWLTPSRIERIERSIVIYNIRKGLDGALDEAIVSGIHKKITNFEQLRFHYFLHRKDWGKIAEIIEALPKKNKNSESMQYWYARSLENIKTSTAQSNVKPNATDIYERLSTRRSYYGFLSAERINKPYKIALGGHHYNKSFLKTLASYPGVLRAYELFRLNQIEYAEKEWLTVLSTLSKKEKVAATILAFQWGMHHFSINTAVNAHAYNFLSARFPLAHQHYFENQSKRLDIDLNWLMAVTRQESAFDHRAISSANARGLMQIIPDTAKETAEKFNIPYNGVYELFSPKTNITLGSHYLHWMADRFSNNRILATASYNAGPHRVETWLQNKNDNLPADIWIELIPFKETRTYVKRVLAYSVIYQHRLGQEPSLLKPHEKQISKEQDLYLQKNIAQNNFRVNTSKEKSPFYLSDDIITTNEAKTKQLKPTQDHE